MGGGGDVLPYMGCAAVMVFKQFSLGEGVEIRWFGPRMGYHFPGSWMG